MSTTLIDIEAVRARFSSLRSGFAFLDAPGGTQVPDEVGEAMARTLREASGNTGAPYATSKAVEAILARAKENAAGFLGCTPDEIVFGANMTTLDFMLSRTAGREFESGGEILVTALDHDGGVAPWLELAADRGLELKIVDATPDFTIDYDDLERKLSDRTRVIAFAWASNAVGSLADAERICALAREAGALSWVDAVHYAAHEPIDVEAIGCDVLICSPYKFCGPHLGVAFVRRAVAETWRPYKARPHPNDPLGRRFETGTPPFELLAGFNATIDYLASIGGIDAIRAYERSLGERFLAGLPGNITLHGLPTMEGRVPTFLLSIDGVDSGEAAERLAQQGIGVWGYAGNWYCVGLTERLQDSTMRIGFIHYNTVDEVDRALEALSEL